MPQNKRPNQRSRKNLPRRNGPPQRKTRGPPVAYRAVNRSRSQRVTNVTSNTQTVFHREFIGSVVTQNTAEFQIVKTLPLNPGLSAAFPWLSATAKNYESYKFNKLQIEYVPTCPTTTTGKLSMLIDYDALDNPPSNAIQLQNSAGAVSTQLWSPATLTASAEQMNKAYKSKYVRNTNIPQNGDLKTYDAGNLYIAVEGNASSAAVGDVYIRYSVTLLTPQLGLASLNEDIQTFKTNSGTGSHPLNNAVKTGVPLVEVVPNPSYDRVTFNAPGEYLVDFLSNSLKANDGGNFNGGTNANHKTTLWSTKTPGYGQNIQTLFQVLAGQYFDIAGTGSTDVNQFKDVKMAISKLNAQDYINLKGLLDDDTSIYIVGDSYEDLT